MFVCMYIHQSLRCSAASVQLAVHVIRPSGNACMLSYATHTGINTRQHTHTHPSIHKPHKIP